MSKEEKPELLRSTVRMGGKRGLLFSNYQRFDLGKNGIRIFSILRNTVFCLCVAALSACVMYMPAARDDFSVLGNDPFSNLIRDGRYEKANASLYRDVGVSMLDRGKMTALSLDIFLRKELPEVTSLFGRHGGECSSPKNDVEKVLLSCAVDRHWKLKNIGAPFDTSNWSDPAVRLLYRFTLSRTGAVIELNLELIDITEHRQIKG